MSANGAWRVLISCPAHTIKKEGERKREGERERENVAGSARAEHAGKLTGLFSRGALHLSTRIRNIFPSLNEKRTSRPCRRELDEFHVLICLMT